VVAGQATEVVMRPLVALVGVVRGVYPMALMPEVAAAVAPTQALGWGILPLAAAVALGVFLTMRVRMVMAEAADLVAGVTVGNPLVAVVGPLASRGLL